MEKELNIISLGAGVQSSTMALMAAHGELTPRPAYAIFADTKFEPEGVYKHLDWLESVVSNPLRVNNPFPILRVTAGDIAADHIAGERSGKKRKYASMPLFTAKGMGMRQCTADYKIFPIRKKLRELLGLKYRQRAPRKIAERQWLGISTDEATRMKPSRDAWVENVWPLIEMNMSRQDCLRWFEKKYPRRQLAKSACIACPFHNDAMWRDMKMNDPVSFEQAVEFDNAIRINRASGKDQYVHRSGKPLSEVDFRNLEDKGQLNMFENECEGYCGV